MRLPLPARIGLYFIFAPLLFDLIFHYLGDAEYLLPGIGVFSIFLMPVGLILLLGTWIFKSSERRREKFQIPSITPLVTKEIELHIGPGQPISEQAQGEIKPGSPPRFLLWPGVVLAVIGFGTFTSVEYWMATRIFTPVDMPVSLALGHIRTGPFKINLKNNYAISLNATDYTRITGQCMSSPRYKVRWNLYKAGRVVASGSPDDENYYYFYYGGGFAADSGVYDLDMEVLSDGSCLNPGYPRLKIFTDRDEYQGGITALSWIAALSAAIGTSLVIIVVFAERKPVATKPILTGAASFGQHFQWAQKLPLRQPFSGFATFGILGVFIYFLFVVPVWVITSVHLIPKGLAVQLLQPGVPPPGTDKWTPPLIVRIKDMGPAALPQLYVNSAAVSWNDLGKTLKTELGHRPEWVVYVEGDPNLPYANVATVIDVAKSMQAKVVLLTPQTEFKSPIQ